MSYAARSASSSSRRMASVRPGMSGCLRRHSSMRSRSSGASLRTVANVWTASLAMPDAITDFTARCNAIDTADNSGKTVISVIGYGSPSVPKALDLAGQKFGRLTAVSAAGPDAFEKIQWLFVCDCGNQTVATGSLVKRGSTVSCGCYANEVRTENSRNNREKIAAAKTKHGASGKLPEYAVWKTMRQRCTNPNSADYPDYGGRGIAVCERWDSFELFLADMGRRPSNEHSIDREDNSKGYEPSNCRWTDKFTQAGNRRPRGAR